MSAAQDWITDHIGPVEVVVFTLPATGSSSAWNSLLAAVDAHSVRLLDLEFVRRISADEVEILSAEDLPDLVPVTELSGATSELVGEEDALELLGELADGEVAAVVLVEHIALLPVLHDFEDSGSRLLLTGSVELAALEEALDEPVTSEND